MTEDDNSNITTPRKGSKIKKGDKKKSTSKSSKGSRGSGSRKKKNGKKILVRKKKSIGSRGSRGRASSNISKGSKGSKGKGSKSKKRNSLKKQADKAFKNFDESFVNDNDDDNNDDDDDDAKREAYNSRKPVAELNMNDRSNSVESWDDNPDDMLNIGNYIDGKPKEPKWMGLIRIIAFMGGIALGFYLTILLVRTFNTAILNATESIQNAGVFGYLIFFIVYVVVTVAFIPASLLTVAAGFIWGIGLGTAIVVVSATAGASLAFIAGKYCLKGWVENKLNSTYPNFHKVDAAIARNGIKINALIRLSPLIPFNLLNYALATTSMTFVQNLIGTPLGITPGTTLYVYIGTTIEALSADRETTTLERTFSIVGVFLTIAIIVFLYKWAKKEIEKATMEADSKMDQEDRMEEGGIQHQEQNDDGNEVNDNEQEDSDDDEQEDSD